MKHAQALGSLIFFIAFFGGIYLMYNNGNLAFFFGKTTKVNAQIDSIKVIHGMAGRGYNQEVFYHYMYKNNTYNSSFRNTATRWEPLVLKDSLKLKISTNNPTNNKVVGVYFSYR